MTAPTPEEIEAVARAICASHGCEMSICPDDGVTCRGNITDDNRITATAAIQALRSLAPPGEDVAGLVAEAARSVGVHHDHEKIENLSWNELKLTAQALAARLANALDNQHP